MESDTTANPQPDAGRLAAVLSDVRARRAAGEALSDDAVLAAHPDLAPELAAELQKLQLVQRARRLAGAAGATTAAGATPAPDAAAPLAPDSIRGYQILREIHRGSQGVVYRAIQKSTSREVAIKVIRQGPFSDPEDRGRFEREVRVLSALKHPNIVSIHDSGTAAGHPYFVMNYIEGEPLDEYVAHADRSIDTVLRLFVKICDAVSAAQIRGFIHRDLKPGNIRIDRAGEPHILDFGLAKIDPSAAARAGAREAALAQAGPASATHVGPHAFTQTGQFVGSLPWASPEQADGQAGDVDVRTDVYSLGVILYQALTGRFPYPVTGGFKAVLDNIQNATPTRPSLLRREINDEVETIVLRCLSKDRARRYQNAGELSADLQRFLRGEPIDAKRDSRLYVLRKQLRRYRVPVAAALIVFVALVAGVVATTRATWRALRAEAVALERALAEATLRESADWQSYKACLVAADAALSVNDTVAATTRLDAAPAQLRGWEWRYLHARLDQSLATFTLDEPSAGRFALAPDGRRAFVATASGAVVAFDPRSGRIERRLTPAAAEASSLALSRDGLRLALGLRSGEISVCDAEDGRERLRFRASPAAAVTALALSADAALLATGAWTEQKECSIQLWDAATGQPRGVLDAPGSWVVTLAFGPDGRVLASGHTKPNAGVRLWDVASGRELAAVNYEGLDVTHVEFSPTGDAVAVASQGPAIKLIDSQTGRERLTLSGHTARVHHVEFSPDGRRLASVSADQSLRVWDLATGDVVASRRGHANGASQVAFLPGREDLLSVSRDGATFKLWDTLSIDEPRTFDTGKYFVLFVAFSPDGQRLFTHQRCWDTATGAELLRLSPRPGWETNAWLRSDVRTEWVMNAAGNGALLLDGRLVFRTEEPLHLRAVSSADGRLAAVGLKRGVLQVVRTDDAAVRCEVPLDTTSQGGVAFSHGGERVITWTDDGHWTVWDVASGQALLSRRHGTQEIVNIAFSADDRLLATASYDGAARICDAASGNVLHELRAAGVPPGDPSVVWSVAFSPDGARLATGSKDRRIRLWDVASGQELLALTRHAGTVMCLDWSPDGTQLASGGFEGAVCLWDSLSRAERAARATGPGGPPAATAPSNRRADPR